MTENVDTAKFREIANILFPGGGFFGDSPDFALTVDVGTLVDKVLFQIDGPEPEILNIGAVRFFGSDGEELSRADICSSVRFSTVFGNKTPDLMSRQFLEGKMIHTDRETQPALAIEFREPVELSRIEIYNRGDVNSRRAKYLRIRTFLSDDERSSHSNWGPDRELEELEAVLQDLGLQDAVRDDPGEAGPFIDTVRSRIVRQLETGELDWSFHRLAQFLPLYEPNCELTDFHISICAGIILKFLEKDKATRKGRLRALRRLFTTDLRFRRLTDEASRLLTAREGAKTQIVLSKHTIHRALLLDKKEEFLKALDEIFELIEGYGAKVMLCYGSLLGAVREGRFLAHDDDVDIIWYIENITSRDEMLEEKEKLISYIEKQGRNAWGKEYDNFHVAFGGISIDIFPCWREGNDVHLMMERLKYRSIPIDIFLPTSSVKLYDRTYPAPAQPEAFLAQRYGKNWATPDPYHEWSWPLARLVTGQNPEILRTKELRAQRPRKRLDRTSMVAWGQRVGPPQESAPKNSIPLIYQAVDHGYDIIELDIRISADDIPVLSHDDRVLGPDGEIFVSKAPASKLSEFRLNSKTGGDVFLPTLKDALACVGDKDVLLDPRILPDQIQHIRKCIDETGFDPSRLQFCVYDLIEAEPYLRYFPESVLLLKIGKWADDVGEWALDEVEALGLDGVMMFSPMYDQDFSAFMTRLRKRNLRVLFYIHGAGYPKRPYSDNVPLSLQNMVDAGVDYVTTTASHLPLFRKLVGRD